VQILAAVVLHEHNAVLLHTSLPSHFTRTTPSKTTPGLDEVMILLSTLLWGSLTALLSLVLL
jgi:hypothetical protein